MNKRLFIRRIARTSLASHEDQHEDQTDLLAVRVAMSGRFDATLGS
jgi:hypothetical protein